MEMNLSNENSLQVLNVCRVCLEQSSKLYPLEGPVLNLDVNISTMIVYCTSIEIVLDKDLPNGVCIPCFKTIRIAYNFIKQFKNTNSKLLAEREIKRNTLQNIKKGPSDNLQNLPILTTTQCLNIANSNLKLLIVKTCDNHSLQNSHLVEHNYIRNDKKSGNNLPDKIGLSPRLILPKVSENSRPLNDGQSQSLVQNNLQHSSDSRHSKLEKIGNNLHVDKEINTNQYETVFVKEEPHTDHLNQFEIEIQSEDPISSSNLEENSNVESNPGSKTLKTNAERNRKNKKIVLKVKKENPDKKLSIRCLLLKKYPCPVCSKIFFSFRGPLVKHLKLFHKDILFKCDKCPLRGEFTIDSYIQHYTKNHLYQCPDCHQIVSSKSSFYSHLKKHNKMENKIQNQSWKCSHPNCNRIFTTELNLKNHLNSRFHKDHICCKCGLKFSTYDTYRYHLKTHDGQRNYLCSECGKTFLQSVHLKYHMWHHKGVKQFNCKDCDKGYTTITQLKKHRRKYCGSTEKSDS